MPKLETNCRGAYPSTPPPDTSRNWYDDSAQNELNVIRIASSRSPMISLARPDAVQFVAVVDTSLSLSLSPIHVASSRDWCHTRQRNRRRARTARGSRRPRNKRRLLREMEADRTEAREPRRYGRSRSTTTIARLDGSPSVIE